MAEMFVEYAIESPLSNRAVSMYWDSESDGAAQGSCRAWLSGPAQQSS